MKNQLIFGWLNRDTDDVFSGKVDAGLTAMTGNANFLELASEVADCKTSYSLYLTAKANAAQGGADNISLRNTARRTLVDTGLNPLLSNINAIAQGDLVKLISSSFPLNKASRTPIGELTPPATPVASQGMVSGVLIAVTNAVYGAALYTARLALASAPTAYVQTLQGTSTRFTFSGLIPGEVYNVDMNAIGTAGPTDFSDVGTLRVI